MGLNGKQLYGLKRWLAIIKMAMHKELGAFSLREKLAMMHVLKEVKLTKLDDLIYSNTFTPVFPSPAYDRYLRGVKSILSGKPLPVITNFAVTAICRKE